MKTLSLLLSLMVLLLNGIPCCADECEEGLSVEQEQNGGESHPEEACSPFLSCGACAGFVPFEPEEKPAAVSRVTGKELPSATEGSCSKYIRDIWEPPQPANA